MSLQVETSLEQLPIQNAPTLTIHSVTTLAAGSPATVTNIGTAQDALLDIAIPQGAQGIQGLQGTAGANGSDGADAVNPNFTIGTITNLAPGSTPTVTVSGTYPDLTLDFGLVRGDVGSGSTVAYGDITGTLSDQTDLQTALDAKAPLNSPTFTGSVNAPTPSPGDNDTSVATTAFVTAALAGLLNNAALTGTPTAPTPTAGDNDTSIATTAFVHTAVAALAPLDSPAFTGNPTVPTAGSSDNDTTIASTAFVKNALSSYAKLDGPLLINDPKADGNLIGYRNLPTSRSTSANITLADSDKGKKIVFTGGTARTFTINPHSSTAIDTDAIITIVNNGTAAITLSRGAGVACKLMGTGADANRTIAAGGVCTLMQVTNDTWFAGGPGVS